jgi:tRNA pseudouridine55 synthase
MARAGETVELAERSVTIHSLDLVSWDGSDPERPVAVVDVACSAGTYVRALARDLGERLGSAAYLGALTRTASGPFTLEAALPLDAIRAAAAEDPSGLAGLLRPIDDGLDAFPVVTLAPDEVAAIARGQFVRPAGGLPGPADHYRLRDEAGSLVAIATATGGRLAPDKVFVNPTATPAPEPVA